MRSRKFVAAAVALVAGASTLVGCGSSDSGGGSSADGEPTIGFVVPLISNPYWELMQEFAEGAAGQLGIDLLTAQADSDESKQINIVQGWISSGVDGIVVGPVSDKVGQTVLREAESAGIPVTFMQRAPGVDLDDSPEDIYVGYVGTDDSGGGTLAAQTLYDSGARKWVAMTGDQGNSVAEQRLAAAEDFVAEHPDVELLKTQYGNEARAAGQQTMENFLSALPGPGFDGVFSFNDEGALGAIQALDNSGDLDSVSVTAMDGTPDAVQAVVDGELLTSVGGGYACGAFALVELYDFIKGHKPDNREVNIPLLPITTENAQAYQDQVINGMDTYDFKAVSQEYTPGASTADFKITLK
ncbi:sugar ABC transporter substrate-binding protein [Nocardioides sp. YIM 152315]|uniref:sugar ABC transporter substrate-binding protein n=1 Tax=Nocardioides sp. YIM 152315 TaxID=3031760 RepID=UPI0023DABACA|nr:sugar ABC transporter substrate-binding protein [Nocardioides sp. YIM 152315]MDF1605823.1 sugar ABC transporter substrate-binding protein [Nocardioides sp. YIM 152315]